MCQNTSLSEPDACNVAVHACICPGVSRDNAMRNSSYLRLESSRRSWVCGSSHPNLSTKQRCYVPAHLNIRVGRRANSSCVDANALLTTCSISYRCLCQPILYYQDKISSKLA